MLYTDGLIEDREQAIDVGMETLRSALNDIRLPPDAVATHVLNKLGRDRGGEDDIALLVMNHGA